MNIGSQLGSYEITSLLGKGGMGEVYRARDSKLKREVAIKILPGEFSRDPERVGRFQREAEALASLNHPNIGSIYEVNEASGSKYLVLELIEGETLADRLNRGALPIDEALLVAKQICEALEAAHQRGVIHRDLKPANIKITPDGTVKLLDFGLARMFEESGTNSELSNSPTLMSRTTPGMIMGTAAYMSPEQARGKAVDWRTDIWSFGCVLFEMLSGRQMFSGETVSDVIAAILKPAPDWTLLPGNLPAAIRKLLQRAIQNNPRLRLQSLGDARIEIEEALQNPAEPTPVVASPRKPVMLLAVVALLSIVVIATSYISFSHFRESPVLPNPVRFEVTIPPEAAFPRIAGSPVLSISPDGKYLAFLANKIGGRLMLWLRSLDSVEARALPGTEVANVNATLFWSDDSRFIAFTNGRELKKVQVDGGSVQKIADLPRPVAGATWGKNGIVFAEADGLHRITADGNIENIKKTDTAAGMIEMRFPQMLPDGDHYLFLARFNNDPQNWQAFVGSLTSPQVQRLISTESKVLFAVPNHILFVRAGNLLAQSFDPVSLKLGNDETPVSNRVSYAADFGAASFSVSQTGVLTFGDVNRNTELVWFDRSGARLRDSLPPDEYGNPALSPDGKFLVIDALDPKARTRDLWMLDLVRGSRTRWSFNPEDDSDAVWSPDSKKIVFGSVHKTFGSLSVRLASSGGDEQRLVENSQALPLLPRDWSADGKYIVYTTGGRLWILPMFGDAKPYRFSETSFAEREGRFSPNVKWLAYDSTESGIRQVYVQPFPDKNGKWQISINGGSIPRWRRDGKELFYLAEDGKLMSAAILSESPFTAAAPQELFQTDLKNFGGGGGLEHYVVSPDGQRFLLNVESVAGAPITVITHWRP